MNRYVIKTAYFYRVPSNEKSHDFNHMLEEMTVHSIDMLWDNHMVCFVDLDGVPIKMPFSFVCKRTGILTETKELHTNIETDWTVKSRVYCFITILERYCNLLNGIFDDYDNNITEWQGVV